MIGSCSLISLILSCFVSIIHPQTSNVLSSAESSSKLGRCACALWGTYDRHCTFDAVLCDQLPHECSSYFWMEVYVSLFYNVFDPFSPKDDEYFKSILQCSKIPVILGYGYQSLREWSIALACCGANGTNVQDEMEGLKAYRKDHPNIAGLALTNLDINSETMNFKDFTYNLNCYIDAVKEYMPDLDIGIYIYANLLQSYTDNPTVEWINFEKLTKAVTFVVVAFTLYGLPCTSDLRDGVFPMTGNYIYTLEKSQKSLIKAGVPPHMTHFRFEIGPTGEINTEGSSNLCNINVKKMCLNPKKATTFCSDNTTTYYEKGVFAKSYGVGIVAAQVDKDDLKNCDCHCGRSFPSFRAILDGYEGAPRPPSCALLDRK